VDLTDYMKALRRRWRVIAAAVVVAMAAGALTTLIGPGSSDEKQYDAGAAVLSTDREGTNLFTVAALTQFGRVPERVAKALNYQGDPRDLGEQITVDPKGEVGIMWIYTTASSPDRAALIANTFAHELVKFVTENQKQNSEATAQRLRRQIRGMRDRIANLESRIASAGGTQATLLTAERDAAIRNYGFLADQYQTATEETLEPTPIQVLQEARGGPISGSGPLGAASLTSRLVLAGILGLLAGIALALALERFDTRIRTKKSAETHFSLPVLAEIPATPRRKRDRGILAATHPKSPFADAFRLLATGLTGRSPATGPRGGTQAAEQSPQTILVTSPAQGEGKTTVTANLAASFAEQGKNVLVLSCDFRSPDIHRMFDVSNDKGLAEALRSQSDGGILLNGHVKKTSIREIRVVPSSAGPENPGALLSSDNMQDVLQEARENADVVLLDTAPILTGGEAAALFPEVDAVLVVARVGTTTVDLAERTSELLTRLGTPVVGVALNGATEGGVSRRDYRSPKPSAKQARPKSREAGSRKDPKAAAIKADAETRRKTASSSEKLPAKAGSGKETGALQPAAKSRTRESRRSESVASRGGSAKTDESNGMKKWEL